MKSEPSAQLIARWQTGDQQAANELFHRYAHRLMSLARSRISRKLGRRVAAEDIVQSAYRTFFERARRENYILQRNGDLWQILVAIVVNKVRKSVEYHTAKKRTIQYEQEVESVCDSVSVLPVALARAPTGVEALALIEEVRAALEHSDSLARQVLELRLRGHTTLEIAARINRTERTVRRLLKSIRDQLEKRLRSV